MYIEFEVTVNLNTYEENLEAFPAVTICNINPFDSSVAATKTLLDLQIKTNGLNTSITASEDKPAIYQVRQIMKILKSSAMSLYNSNSTLAESLSYSLDSMLISCYFNGIKCNSSDFSKFYSYEYGNCYTFNKNNGSSLKQTSKSGPESGLSLELYTGYPGKQDYYIEQRGFYVAVHNNSQIPLTKFDGIKIPVGYSSYIPVKRTFYERLSSPYSSCKEDVQSISSTDSDYYKATLAYTKYTVKLCYEICLQYKFIIPGCNCSDASIPITDNKQRICSSLADINCVDSKKTFFDSSDLSSTCAEFCPTECEKIVYDTSINLADYPTSYYYEIVSKQKNLLSKFSTFTNSTPSYALFKESVLMVNVFYQDLTYTHISESPSYNFADILGIVGRSTYSG